MNRASPMYVTAILAFAPVDSGELGVVAVFAGNGWGIKVLVALAL